MLFSIGINDLTNIVQESTFLVDCLDEYEEWLDGNRTTHRLVIRQRIKGEFNIALYGRDGYTAKEFLDLFNSAVNNNIINFGVWVTNLNKFKNIEAYYTLTSTKHRQLNDGSYFDEFRFIFEEK